MKFLYKIHNFFCVDAISIGVQEFTSEEIVGKMRADPNETKRSSSPYAILAWHILRHKPTVEKDKVFTEDISNIRG